jgi:DNA polymerase III epsilon subunit-like protein
VINICLDVETGGLVAGNTEMIQLGAAVFDSKFKAVSVFSSLILPTYLNELDGFALEKNKIAIDSLQKAPTAVEVRNSFYSWIKSLGGDSEKLFPLGHNYAFDKGFLELFFGKENYQELFYYKHRDSFAFAQGLVDSGSLSLVQEDLSLENLSKYFGFLHDAHDALGDVYATLNVYKRLTKISSNNEVPVCDNCGEPLLYSKEGTCDRCMMLASM